MSIFDRAIGRIQENMVKEINCIPWGLPRFEVYNPGIIKKRYAIITANSGVGKSSFADHMYLYNVYDFIKKNPGIKAKIFYYSLEIDKETKLINGISRRLFTQFGIVADSKTLLSYSKNRCSQEILEKINLTRDYFEELEDVLIISDDNINPLGIYKDIEAYANTNGKTFYKNTEFTKPDGTTETKVGFDYYIPNNPDEYVFIIVDHAALLNEEKGFDGNKTIKGTIEKHSLNMVKVRNRYSYNPVLIYQQSAAKESNESVKLNKLEPSREGLGESKVPTRDCDLMLGLFSPALHELPTYRKYDITRLKDNYRFLQVLKDRYGEMNVSTHLYFNGAVGYFAELPKADEMSTDKYVNIHKLMKP